MAALCFDPIGQGERVQWLDATGRPALTGSTTEHTLVGIGALLVGRHAAGYRIWDGDPAASTTWRAGPRSTPAARLHGQLGRRHADRLPDGPRRPDRRRGAVVLHHLAGAALRHDRPAGRRAEHHRPGRLRHGARRLPDDARPEADLAVRRHAGLLRHRRGLGHLPRGQAGLRPARPRRAGRPVRVGRDARLHPAPPRGGMRWMRRWLLLKDDAPVEPDFPIAADDQLRSPASARSCASSPGRSRSSTSTPSGPTSWPGSGPGDPPAGRPRQFRAEVRARLALPGRPRRWSSPAMPTWSAATGTRSTDGPSRPSPA